VHTACEVSVSSLGWLAWKSVGEFGNYVQGVYSWHIGISG